MKNLIPVIDVDSAKCVNCHACITVCPVKFCIDASQNTVEINHNLCIGCGSCISACKAGARSGKDDFASFFESINKREKMVMIAAPAIVSTFPDTYLNLLGYFKSLGISDFFDVSFGAELTVKSYLEHIDKEKPLTLIAQPCPAIVSYAEIYQPELLQYLAPADSPMVHTMKMIRQFYPEYKDHKIAVLSPCYAKKREFEETGYGDYNITLNSVNRWLENNKIDLKSYQEVSFKNPPAERAVMFSSPGGLMKTIEREKPELLPKIRKIDGVTSVYHYFREFKELLDSKRLPLVIDCLNCEHGCNGGAGTPNTRKNLDIIEFPIENRKVDMMNLYHKKSLFSKNITDRKKINSILNRYRQHNLYKRNYENRKDTYLFKEAPPEESKKIAESMFKYNESDFYDCSACGYGCCNNMIKAIYNKLNKPENCYHYEKQVISNHAKMLEKLNKELTEKINEADKNVKEMDITFTTLDKSTNIQVNAVTESSAVIEQMISSIQKIDNNARQKRSTIETLNTQIISSEKDIKDTIEAVEKITNSIIEIQSIINVINDIAARSNLLAINASIEATHAGETGNGFAVVAREMGNLSKGTGNYATKISNSLQKIAKDSNSTRNNTDKMNLTIKNVIDSINEISLTLNEITGSLHEQASGCSLITNMLSDLQETTRTVSTCYSDAKCSSNTIKQTIEHMTLLCIEILNINAKIIKKRSTFQT